MDQLIKSNPGLIALLIFAVIGILAFSAVMGDYSMWQNKEWMESIFHQNALEDAMR